MKPKNKFLTFYFLQQVIVSCIMCNKTTIFFLQCTCQHMCFCGPAPALWPHCWWIHPWRWRPAEGTSAAWAAGTPRTAPPAGWCLACQLSSSGRTRTPASEWPEEQRSRDAIRSTVKVGEASVETTTPVRLRDVACANIHLCCQDESTVWYQMAQLPREGSRELNQCVSNKARANTHTLAPALKPPRITPWTNMPDRRGDGGTSLALVKMHDRSPYGQEYVQRLFVLAAPGLDKTRYSATKATQGTDLSPD